MLALLSSYALPSGGKSKDAVVHWVLTISLAKPILGRRDRLIVLVLAFFSYNLISNHAVVDYDYFCCEVV